MYDAGSFNTRRAYLAARFIKEWDLEKCRSWMINTPAKSFYKYYMYRELVAYQLKFKEEQACEELKKLVCCPPEVADMYAEYDHAICAYERVVFGENPF